MDALKAQLQRHFPYSDFRPGQREVLEFLAAGQAVLGLMPTGSGKSFLYQFFAKTRPGLTLVVSPLIALMQDQTEKALELGISASFVNSSLSKEEREKRQARLAQGEFQLFFVTPERFRRPGFFEALSSREISLFAVDEAHCVSLWGHDFRPDYAKLAEVRDRLGRPLTLAVTATATPDVQKDILLKLGIAQAKTVFSGLERPNLALAAEDFAALEDKLEALLPRLQSRQGTTLIYVTLIDTLRRVSRFLESKKMSHLIYHGELPSQVRRRALESFMKESSPLMLATPAFGLGIDRADVRLLVHLEMPGSLEAYFQEVGRAGRDGQPAQGFLLFDEEVDTSLQMEFLKWAHPEESFLRRLWQLIKSREAEVDQGGFDFLREQMSFKNRRDHRVEAGVHILERWGCLERQETPFPFRAVEEPQDSHFAEEKAPERLRHQNMKLLAMLRWAKDQESCRMQQISEYFGVQGAKECGVCDNCRRAL